MQDLKCYCFNLLQLGQTFAEFTDVLWELQICTAQGRGKQTDWLLKGRIEARDPIEQGVPKQLCRGQPGEHTKVLQS